MIVHTAFPFASLFLFTL